MPRWTWDAREVRHIAEIGKQIAHCIAQQGIVTLTNGQVITGQIFPATQSHDPDTGQYAGSLMVRIDQEREMVFDYLDVRDVRCNPS